MDALINIKNFRLLSEFETLKKKLDIKGLYALRVKDISNLPPLFKNELVSTETLIYIGKAEKQTIYDRLLQECQGKGHGTFFRGIGSLLNFKPEKGSLRGKENKNNYSFSKNDKEEIVNWMNENLILNFVKVENNILGVESKLIGRYCPILNTTYNPHKSKTLAILRKSCREFALLE
jgi:hypothetical protein